MGSRSHVLGADCRMHFLTSDSDTGWKVENVADVKGCDGEGLVTVWEFNPFIKYLSHFPHILAISHKSTLFHTYFSRFSNA